MEEVVVQSYHHTDSSIEQDKSKYAMNHEDELTVSMGCCNSKSGEYPVSLEDVSLEEQNTSENEKEDTAVIEYAGKDTPNVALNSLRQAKTNDDDDYDFEEELHNEDKSYYEAYKKFEYFWRSESVCSQWYKSTFSADGKTFTCAEQYMMYQKAVLFEDKEIADEILRNTSPRKIKQLGREVHGFVEEVWQYHCLEIVKRGNMAKFSKTPKLREKLMKTYPKVLVEASPYDRIWGIGLEESEPEAWNESSWRGTNYLGYILTEVRNDIMIDMRKLSEDERMNFVEKETEKRRRAYEDYERAIRESLKNVTNKESNQSKTNSVKGDSASNSSRSFNSNPTKTQSSSDAKSQKNSKTSMKASGNDSIHKESDAENKKQGKQVRERDEGKRMSSGEPRKAEKDISIESDEHDQEWEKVQHHGNRTSKKLSQVQPPSPQKEKKRNRKKKNSKVDGESESKTQNLPKIRNYDDNTDQVSGSKRSRKKLQEKESGSGMLSSSEPSTSNKIETTVDKPHHVPEENNKMSSSKPDISNKEETTVDMPHHIPEEKNLSRRQKKNANRKAKK